MKDRLNNKQITTISIVFIVMVFLLIMLGSFANGTFQFSIDDNTQKAINDLSRFSDEPFSLTVNNYHSDQTSCLYGCQYAFDKMAGGDNVICVGLFCKSECENVCQQREDSE